MSSRHNLARIAQLACTLVGLTGCFGSHGIDGEERADAGVLPAGDAGVTPDRDAGPPGPGPGPGPGPMPGPGPGPGPEPGPEPATCGVPDTLRIRLEALGTHACSPGRYEGVMLYGVEPADFGVRLLLDLCPLADADCRCAVTVSGVAPDVAFDVDTHPDSGPTMMAVLADGGVLVEAQRDCAIADGSCVQKVVFAAMDGLLESPPFDASALDVQWGEERTCAGAAPDLGPDCTRTGYPLAVTSWTDGFPGPIGFEQTVYESTRVTLDDVGPTMFEAVRANAPSCPDARFARTAAWVAWAALRPAE